MRRLADQAERKAWAAIVADPAAVAPPQHLPGPKGQELLRRLVAARDRAVASQSRAQELRAGIDTAVDAAEYERALEALAEYRELVPDDAETAALGPAIGSRAACSRSWSCTASSAARRRGAGMKPRARPPPR